MRSAPTPLTYKRHYPRHSDELNFQHTSLDFDAIAELGFADRSAFLNWLAAVTTGEGGERVAEDEARFLDRSRTRSCVVEDRVTSG